MEVAVGGSQITIAKAVESADGCSYVWAGACKHGLERAVVMRYGYVAC